MNFQAREERTTVWQCSECGTVKEGRAGGGTGVMAVLTCDQCNERQVFEQATV